MHHNYFAKDDMIPPYRGKGRVVQAACWQGKTTLNQREQWQALCTPTWYTLVDWEGIKPPTMMFTPSWLTTRLVIIPLTDVFGMKPAILSLMHSLSVGKYMPFLCSSTCENSKYLLECLPCLLRCNWNSMAIMAKDKVKTFMMSCPAYSYWFEHFK